MADDASMDGAESEPSTKPMDKLSTKPSIKPTKKKTRRGLNSKNKNKAINLSIMGHNCVGLLSKMNSFLCTLDELVPSIVMLQETKVPKPGMIKIQGYQVFEKVRQQKSGGGLLIAVENNLNPVLIDVDDSVEVLIVKINLPIGNAFVINGYGPQETEEFTKRVKFWQSFEVLIKKATKKGHFYSTVGC